MYRPEIVDQINALNALARLLVPRAIEVGFQFDLDDQYHQDLLKFRDPTHHDRHLPPGYYIEHLMTTFSLREYSEQDAGKDYQDGTDTKGLKIEYRQNKRGDDGSWQLCGTIDAQKKTGPLLVVSYHLDSDGEYHFRFVIVPTSGRPVKITWNKDTYEVGNRNNDKQVVSLDEFFQLDRFYK